MFKKGRITALLCCMVLLFCGQASAFQIDYGDGQQYFAPFWFGPYNWVDPEVAHFDGPSSGFSISFYMDYDAAAELLPYWTGKNGKTYGVRPIAMPNGMASLSIGFTGNMGCDFLAGGGYNITSVNLMAEFIGENSWRYDGVKYCAARGPFPLILWEDQVLPMILGTYGLGITKLFANMDWTNTSYVDAAKDTGYAVVHTSDTSKSQNVFVIGEFWNAPSAPIVYKPTTGLKPVPTKFQGWGKCQNYDPAKPSTYEGTLIGWKYVQKPDQTMAHLNYAIGSRGNNCPDPNNKVTCCTADKWADQKVSLTGSGNVTFPKHYNDQADFPTSWHIVNKLKALFDAGKILPFPGNATIKGGGCSNLWIPTYHVMDGPTLPSGEEPGWPHFPGHH